MMKMLKISRDEKLERIGEEDSISRREEKFLLRVDSN